jgi:Asp-tRNA(Asn)/Glu-tRNA(Gln) amidotransferase A subunit family amidase
MTAHEMVAGYRSGDLSPVDVTQAFLARIQRINGKVNAICFVNSEDALAAARQSEARWQAGQPAGLLDGVPVTLKDSIQARGTLTSFGSLAGNPERIVDTIDAPLAARLRDSGAIILAKTTMPDFGLIASGVSSRYGITPNPWNPARNAGGSSSGAAVSLATGLCPIAIGTDGGGSIRIPSAFCGVFGMKPSFGRVPYLNPSQWVVAGPMTRSVVDAALAMNIISRPDTRDYSSLPYDPVDYCDQISDGVKGFRIGVMEDIGFGLKVDPQVRDKLLAAAAVFERQGATVDLVPPIYSTDPEIDFDRILHLRTFLQFASMSPDQQDLMLPALANWCRRINAEPKQELMQSLINVGDIRRAALAPFEKFDFLLAPVMAVLPYPADRLWPEDGTAHNPFCFPFNMSEQPAAAIHGGFSREHLPIGLQIIGRRFDDRGVLRTAFTYELATGYLDQRPMIDCQPANS